MGKKILLVANNRFNERPVKLDVLYDSSTWKYYFGRLHKRKKNTTAFKTLFKVYSTASKSTAFERSKMLLLLGG